MSLISPDKLFPRSTWAVFQMMQRSSYLQPLYSEALLRNSSPTAALLLEERLGGSCPCKACYLWEHAREEAPRIPKRRKECAVPQHVSTPMLHALGSTVMGMRWVTYLLGFLGLMLTGGPGGPSFLGKMSTHICTFP